jgi:pSer/pThr/pTyr-binding forkhead associated (FHA) protein
MHNEREASIQPGQAALIVTYGNTTRRFRPLEGDLVVIGRAPICDIALISPEVAPVHCILQHRSDGWRIRDCCGGRHVTRLNGRPIHEAALHDGDVLQIGTFSFEARLPPPRPTCSAATVEDRLSARLKSLQRSRRNLVRLALRLRRKARKANSLPPTLAELEQQAESLRNLQRDYQARMKEYQTRLDQLEQAERELCDARAAFERECIERQIRLEKTEHEAARSVRDRLANLSCLKQEIAGMSSSAPGDQLRAQAPSHSPAAPAGNAFARVGENPARSAAD